jgi:membrane associated rhomboid family serine protease
MGSAFGIDWDPSSWAVRLAVATLAISVITMGAHLASPVFAEAMARAFVLTPGQVVHDFAFWQLFTFAFTYTEPIGLLFAVYALWVFGIDIERQIGSRSFVAYFFGLAFAGGVVTTLLSLVFKTLQVVPYQGAFAVGAGLIAVWARLHRGAIVNFFMFPMKAETLAWLTLGMIILYSLAYHPAMFIPDYVAFFAGDLSMRDGFELSPRRTYLRYRAWKIERQLRHRARKFSVIRGGEDDDENDDPKDPRGGYLN